MPSLGQSPPWGHAAISALTSAIQPYFPALLSGPVSSPQGGMPVPAAVSPCTVSPSTSCPHQPHWATLAGSHGACRAFPAPHCLRTSRGAAPAPPVPPGTPRARRRRRKIPPRAPAGCCTSAGEPGATRVCEHGWSIPSHHPSLEHPSCHPNSEHHSCHLHFGASSPVTPLWSISCHLNSEHPSCHPTSKHPLLSPHFGASALVTPL